MSNLDSRAATTDSQPIPSIAFLGPAGTFTEYAAQQFAGSEAVQYYPVASPAEAINSVRSGKTTWAVVALENSVDGPITQSFDALIEGDSVQIVQEIDVAVEFSALSKADWGKQVVQAETYSCHPVAAAQVAAWVKQNMPHAEFVPASSNGAAAALAASGEVDIAIAPRGAAPVYGLVSHQEHIADIPDAHTRFVLVGKPQKSPDATGKDRTAVTIALENVPAALVTALQEISLRGVDLSRIESRPTRSRLGTYVFHIECQGHISQEPIQQALLGLKRRAQKIWFLGSWPQSGFMQDSTESSTGATEPPVLDEEHAWLQDITDGVPREA